MKTPSFTKKQAKNSPTEQTPKGFTVPEIDKQVQHLLYELPKKADREGELLAQSKKPATSETKLVPAEQTYVDTIQGLLVEQNRSITGGEIQILYLQCQRLKSEIEQQGISIDDRKQKEIEQLEQQQEKAQRNTNQHYEAKQQRANEQIEQCHAVHTQAQHQLILISPEAQYGFNKVLYCLVIAVVFLGEIPQLYASFLAFGWNILVVTLLVTGVSASQSLISHFLGMYAKQSESPQKKWTIRFVSVGMLVFFFATGIMRIGESESLLSLLFFTILNAILFFVATWTSLMFHPKNKEAFQKKQRLQNEVQEKERALRQAEQRAEEIQQEYEQECQRIIESFNAQIVALEATVHPLIREYEAKQTLFFAIWQYAQSVEQQAVAIKDITINRFRQANYAIRQESERPQYWDEPLPELRLYFQSFTDFFCAENEAQPSSEPVHPTLSKGNIRAGIGAILLASMFFSGCQFVETDLHTSKAVIAIDVTDSVQASTNDMAQNLLEVIEDIPQGSPIVNRFELDLFLLEDVSLNHRYQVSWSKGSVLENPHQRSQRKQDFVTQLDSVIKGALRLPHGRQNSRIYFPLCNCLNQLAEDKASYRRLIVFSNLLENDLFFSAYSDKGRQDLEHTPEAVEELFRQECELAAHLDGIEVGFVHRPDPDTDRLVLHMQRLYRNMLEAKGATVSFVANL